MYYHHLRATSYCPILLQSRVELYLWRSVFFRNPVSASLNQKKKFVLLIITACNHLTQLISVFHKSNPALKVALYLNWLRNGSSRSRERMQLRHRSPRAKAPCQCQSNDRVEIPDVHKEQRLHGVPIILGAKLYGKGWWWIPRWRKLLLRIRINYKDKEERCCVKRTEAKPWREYKIK